LPPTWQEYLWSTRQRHHWDGVALIVDRSGYLLLLSRLGVDFEIFWLNTRPLLCLFFKEYIITKHVHFIFRLLSPNRSVAGHRPTQLLSRQSITCIGTGLEFSRLGTPPCAWELRSNASRSTVTLPRRRDRKRRRRLLERPTDPKYFRLESYKNGIG
jgi:hypothetical protein